MHCTLQWHQYVDWTIGNPWLMWFRTTFLSLWDTVQAWNSAWSCFLGKVHFRIFRATSMASSRSGAQTLFFVICLVNAATPLLANISGVSTLKACLAIFLVHPAISPVRWYQGGIEPPPAQACRQASNLTYTIYLLAARTHNWHTQLKYICRWESWTMSSYCLYPGWPYPCCTRSRS